jgi:Tol biopolymer transport system component
VTQTLGLALLAFLLSRSPGLATDDADADWSQVTFDDVISVEEQQSDEEQPELGEVVETATDTDATTDSADMASQNDDAVDVTDISWPDRVTPPPEIEPLFVRAFTDVEPGHNDSNPIWSPTGDLIAFERSIEDKREIIISRSDGTVLHKIYHRIPDENSEMDSVFTDILEDASYNAGISWSPDENKLVFMSNGGSGNYDLYLLPNLGQEQTIRLTDHAEKDSHPHWSPVADRLVFVSGRAGSADIYLMDLVSGNVVKLTNGHKTYLYPQWSPDGSKIVMINGSNENHDIFLIEDIYRPLQTLKALTRWAYDDLRPVWSPDGKKIAFYTNYNLENNPKIWSIVVINADGSSPTDDEGLAARVVAVNVIPDIERGPAWMPDSKRLVYVKNDPKTFNPIYMIQIDDNKNQPITTQTKMNHDLACSADGTLAFRAQVEQWDHIYIARLKE